MIFLILALVFVIGEGFFSGIETGFISLRRSRVKHAADKKDENAMILEHYLKRPELILTTASLGTNICLVLSSLCLKQATMDFGLNGGFALLIMTIIMTILLIIVEIVPKDWFRQNAYDRCAIFAKLFHFLALILLPMAMVLTYLTEKFNNLFLNSKTKSKNQGKRNDFIHLLQESESANIIDKQQVGILEKSLDIYSMEVENIMIPQNKVMKVPINSTITNAMNICREHNISRLPIENKDKWIGFFSIYDATISIAETEWDNSKVTACMRPLQSIYSEANTSVILELTNRFKTPILSVIDKNTKKELGLISKMDIVKQLF